MVINASVVGVVHEAAAHEEIEAVYGAINGVEGILKENLVDLTREDPGILERVKLTPSAALGSVRFKVTEHHLPRILDVFEAHNIRYFFYIGGNDSALTSHQVEQLAKERGYDLRVVGIPKTIDNDLEEMDHCPGFGSAARFVITATRCIDKDNEALRPVQFIEVMGRDTGWLAAASRLARVDPERDAPHLIYLPEKHFDETRFLRDIEETQARLGRVVAVVGEGLRREDGSQVTGSTKRDPFGHVQLGGVGDYLTRLVEQELDLKARWDKLGTMQRSFAYCMSQTDLEEAYEVGRLAVAHACEGVSGKMVTVLRAPGPEYRCEYGLTDLMNVAGQTRFLPLEYISRAGNDVEESYIDYVEPLVRGRVTQVGPEIISFARLRGYRVEKRLPEYEESEAVKA